MRTGSIGIVSLTNSAKSKIDLLPNNYPVVKVRPDCSGYVPGPACAGSGSSSDPLVGELVCEITDQGLDGGGHTKTARGPASEPSWDSAWGFGRPGVHPVSSVQLRGASRRFRTSAYSREGGGDEETRTPDLLLAKEMLYQLSYVPFPRGKVWWAFLDSNQRPLPYQGSALTS